LLANLRLDFDELVSKWRVGSLYKGKAAYAALISLEINRFDFNGVQWNG